MLALNECSDRETSIPAQMNHSSIEYECKQTLPSNLNEFESIHGCHDSQIVDLVISW